MTRILFVHNHPQPFVRIDLALLRERWQVDELYQRSKRLNPLAIFARVRRADLVFCWFASWHSLFPALFARLLGVPLIVVVGGYDTANVPEAGYGSQRGGVRKWIAQTIIGAASALIVHSESTKRETMANTDAPADKINVIYLGFDPIDPPGQPERDRIALTVGGVWRENLLRKGLLPFVQTAAHFPDWRFVVVGKWYDGIDALRAAAGANVEVTGFVDDATLADWYRRASVYVQASLHEGFGMSLAEAMSAGCIPVVTRAGSIPEVVGDCGSYAASNQPDDLAAALRAALAASPDRATVRQRVVETFSLERRRQALHALIKRWL
jgi:glycosyltransferase involved in cell wall biosynthesis